MRDDDQSHSKSLGNYRSYIHTNRKIMELAVHPNELLILYDSSSQLSKKTLAFARTVSDHIQEMEFKKTQYRNTIWKEILDLLQVSG